MNILCCEHSCMSTNTLCFTTHLKICADGTRAWGCSLLFMELWEKKKKALTFAILVFDSKTMTYNLKCQEHFKNDYNEHLIRIRSVPLLLSYIKLLHNEEHLSSTSLKRVSFSQAEEHKSRPSMKQRHSPCSNSTLMVHLS